jgi:hypothetical protein
VTADAPSSVNILEQLQCTIQYLEENIVALDTPKVASEENEYILSVPGAQNNSLQMQVVMYHPSTGQPIRTEGLLDSGATGNFVNWKYLVKHKLPAQKLLHPKVAINVDGTVNKKGMITHEIFLPIRYKDHCEMVRFRVTDLGTINLIIGHVWLAHHNPTIDWKKGTMDLNCCPPECDIEEQIRVYQTTSQKLAEQHKSDKTDERQSQKGTFNHDKS